MRASASGSGSRWSRWCSRPLSAVGAAQAGLEGLVVAWAGILGVNVVQARKGLPFRDRYGARDRDR